MINRAEHRTTSCFIPWNNVTGTFALFVRRNELINKAYMGKHLQLIVLNKCSKDVIAQRHHWIWSIQTININRQHQLPIGKWTLHIFKTLFLIQTAWFWAFSNRNTQTLKVYDMRRLCQEHVWMRKTFLAWKESHLNRWKLIQKTFLNRSKKVTDDRLKELFKIYEVIEEFKRACA